MAVLTAKCDRVFLVSKERTQLFKEQKKNEKTIEKNRELTNKIVKKIGIIEEKQ